MGLTRKIIFILFFTSLLNFTFAQDVREVDSLLDYLSTPVFMETKDRIDSVHKVALKFQFSYPLIVERITFKTEEASEKINYLKGKAAAINIRGGAMRVQGNYSDAIKLFSENLKFYQELGDSLSIGDALMSIGVVYNDLKNSNSASEYLRRAISIFEKREDKKRLSKCINNLGLVFYNEANYDSALFYYNKAFSIRLREKDQYGIAESLNNLGLVYKKLKYYDLALKELTKALEIRKKTPSLNGISMSYYNIGNVYQDMGHFKKAEENYNIGLLYADSIDSEELKWEVYEVLYKMRKAQGDFKRALEVHENYLNSGYKIIRDNYNKEIKQLEISFHLKQKEEELEVANQQLAYLEMEKENRRKFNIALVGIGSILLVFASIIIILQRSKIKKSKELHSTQEALIEKEIENRRLREHELRQELDYKNRELTSFTLNFVQKKELLENLQETVNRLIKNTKPFDKNFEDIKQLKQTIQQSGNLEKEWEDFRIYFEKVHGEFFTVLKKWFPDLSGSELKLCSLIRLNLNIKESANMLGVSPESVKKARYRLRKKFNLDTEENLLDFLINIENKETGKQEV